MMVYLNSTLISEGSYRYEFLKGLINIKGANIKLDSMEMLTIIKEDIDKKMDELSLAKEPMPKNVPNWVIKKWRKNNAGKLIELSNRTIALDGGRRLPLLDYKIEELYILSNQIGKCIEKQEPFLIKSDTC